MKRSLALLSIILTVCFAASGFGQTSCPAPTIVQTGGTNPSCAGQPVTLDAGDGWVTYQWSNGATTRMITDTPAATTTYTVTVTDANNCSVTSPPLTVTVDSVSPPVIQAPSSICAGGSGNASAASGPYWSFAWSVPFGGVIAGPANQPSVSFRSTMSAPVQLTLAVTNQDGCPSSSTVSIPVTGNAPFIDAPATVCPSTTTTAFVGNISTNVNWSITNGQLLGSTHSGTAHFRATSSNPVTLTVTGTNGTCAVQASVVIPVVSPAPPVISVDSAPLCAGSSDSASISGWTLITWSIVNGTITSGQNQPAVFFTSDPNGQPVTLSVTASKNSLGCTASNSVTIPVKTIAQPVIHLDTPEVCPGGQDFASIDPPAQGSWSSQNWSIIHGSILSPPNATPVYFAADMSGVPPALTVVATDGSGCQTFGSVTIPFATIAAPEIHLDHTPICAGGSGDQSYAWIDPPATGGWTNVQWSVDNGTIFSRPPNAVIFAPNPDGQPVTITVTATASSGCSATSTVTVPTSATQPPVITVTNPTICSGGSDHASIAPPAPGNQVSWSVYGGSIIGPADGPAIDFRADGSGNLSVFVQVTNESGCSNYTAVTVPLSDGPVPQLSVPSSFCFGTQATASVTDASNYASIDWFINGGTFVGPASGPSVTFVSSGGDVFIKAVGTAAGGCVTQSYTNIHVNTATATVTAGGPTTFCQGGSVTLTASAGTSYLWSTGATTQSISVNQSGAYTVTVTAANGCAATSAPKNVTVNPLPGTTITASGPTTICGGGSVTLTAPAAASYLWSTGESAQSITVSTAGDYTVSMTSTAGCSTTSAPVTIVTRPWPTKAPMFAVPPYVCPNGTRTFTLFEPDEFHSYAWTVTNGSINGASDGSSVSVTAGPDGDLVVGITAIDVNGCTVPATMTIPIRMPEENITLPPAVCLGEEYGVGVLAAYGESYQWSVAGPGTLIGEVNSSQLFLRFDGAGDVTLTLTVTSESGCSRAFSTTTHVYDIPSVSIATPPTACSANGNTATGSGTGVTSYFWSITGGTITGSSTSPAVTYNLTSSQATLRLLGSNGHCSSSTSVVITNGDVPPAVTASGTTDLCPNSSVSLNAPANQTAYLWSTGATTRTITVSQAGDYSVQVTTPAGCTKTSLPVHVTTQNIAPPVVVVSSPFCDTSQTFTTTVTNGANYQTVTTYSNAAYLSSTGNTTTWVKPSDSGPIWVEADAYTGTGCILVTRIDPVPQSIAPDTTIAGPAAVCGTSTFVTSAIPDAGPGATYTWSISSNAEIIGSSSNANVAWRPHNWGSKVTLDVEVTSAAGCSREGFKDVAVNIVPDYHMTTAPVICEHTVGTATAPVIPGAIYGWGLNGASWVSGAGTNSIQFLAPTAGTSFNIDLDISLPGGCHYYDTQYVTPLPAPSATVTASGPTTFCAGGSVTLTAPSATSYLWSNGATTQSINVPTSGTFSVTVTNASGCSATSVPTTVTVNANPSTPLITADGPTTFCAGGSVTLSAPSATSYLWSNGATTQSVNVTTSGTFSVTVTNASGCSATSAATSVTVNANPSAPVITADGPTAFCAGASVTLSAPSATSYLWSNGATTQSINVPTSGTFSVTVTNASGCSATSAAATVTVNANPSTPVITADGATTFCAGGSVTLTAPSAVSYLWSNGATTQSINVTTSGTFSVTVTNASGCSATSAATAVTVNAAPATPVITAGGPTTFCAGGSVTLTAPSAAGYLWSNGATTQSINVTTSGTYSVTVTNASGCSATSASTTVTVNAAPTTPTITAGGSTTFCAGGSVTLTASSAGSYLWSNGATTQSINVTTSGTFSVTVTNASGCSATSAATTVTVNANPSTPVITADGPTTFCAGGSVTLTAPSATSYLWSNGATTQSINVTTSGTFSVTVTNASGCSATSAATTVTVNAVPATPTITAGGPTTFCAGGSVTLTASSAPSYLWSNGATTQSINVTTSGSYSVTVTNAGGCGATSAITPVTVNAKPATPVITPSGPTTFCVGGSVTLTAPAGYTYSWSNGATTQSINVTTSGTFSVTVSNAGCSTTSAATSVTVNANPATPVITPNGSTTFCAGGSVTLTASSAPSYLWSTGATTQAINVTTSGAYSVTVTNASGCSTTSAATTVTVNAKPATPVITPSGSTAICPGSSVTLTAPAGYTYHWSNGPTTQSINVTSAGSYSVTVTNASGCSTASAATAVTMKTTTSLSQPGNKTIARNATTTFTVTASGTNLTYQWYEGTAGNTNSPLGTSATQSVGPYNRKGTFPFWVRVTGDCGVASSNTINLNVN